MKKDLSVVKSIILATATGDFFEMSSPATKKVKSSFGACRSMWLLAICAGIICLFLTSCARSTKLIEQPAKHSKETTSVTVPMIVAYGNILVLGSINGHREYLALDTGAEMDVICSRTSHELGIKPDRRSRAIPVHAVGGWITARTTTIHSIGVEGAEIQDDSALLASSSINDPYSVDILGSNFFSRFVVQIDEMNHSVTIMNPSQFSPPSQACRIPFVLSFGGPVIPIVVDGIRCNVELDTGGANTLEINRTFVDRYNLRKRYPHILQDIGGIGLGGQTKVQAARAKTLKVGNSTLSDPIVLLSEDHDDLATEPDGLLGWKILKRFTVTFDYSRRAVYLQPNQHFSDPFEYGMTAGLWVEKDQIGYRVAYVIPGSPSDLVGVKIGDHIEELNGIDTRTVDDQKVFPILSGAPGTLVHAVIRPHSGGKPRRIVFALRELI